jgi:hypothetical protein
LKPEAPEGTYYSFDAMRIRHIAQTMNIGMDTNVENFLRRHMSVFAFIFSILGLILERLEFSICFQRDIWEREKCQLDGFVLKWIPV